MFRYPEGKLPAQLSWPLVALLVGCVTSEETYGQIAKKHLAQGPIAACCETSADSPRTVADRTKCEATAESRCGFVRDAKINVIHVSRFGHDDGATVELTADGPHGQGSCTCQLLNWPRRDVHVQACGCQAK